MQGVELELPPILLGRYGTDPTKKIVLVYGHYDVYFPLHICLKRRQPALKDDGWTTEPFVLTHDKDTDRLYGRDQPMIKVPF
jgi:Cys-Gly metallodipeptidase DUG1